MKVERLNESRERIHIYVNQRSPALNQTRANTPFLPSPTIPASPVSRNQPYLFL